MLDNSYAIYQVKEGQDYHMLRFASLAELNRDALRLWRDVHKVLNAANGAVFPDKAAAEEYLRDEGLAVIPGVDPQRITVRNAALQEAVFNLTPEDGGCRLKGCDTRAVDQSVRPEHYSLVYTGLLPSSGTQEPHSILEGLYERFNLDRPDDFHGHSLRVSDVVVLKQHGQMTGYYTDSMGFQKLKDFVPPENALRSAEMAMEDDLNMIDGIINNGPREEKTPRAPGKPEHLPRPRHRNEPER